MAYSQTLELVVGDTRPNLTFTLRDSNTAAVGKRLDENDELTWAPIDLTGATVKLHIREIGSTTLKASLTCTAVDAENGEFVTGFPSPTLDTAGLFEAEVEITYGDGGVQTVQDFLKLKVRDDIN